MGTLLIDREVPSFEGGVGHVWVEEPAPADALARRIAETEVNNIAHHSGVAEEIMFSIRGAGGWPAHARLRAWVDIEGRGRPGPDDLYSVEAVKVSDTPCVLRVEASSHSEERS